MLTARTQEVLYDPNAVYGTQSLILDCEDGRPSSITDVQVWYVDDDDDATEESATTGSASVETSPNTTISAAAGPAQSDPRALTLTSATGVAIGRRYQITEDNGGHWEVVEVAKINSTSVTLRHPLKNDYTSGSTFQSTRATIALSSTWVADEDNVTALWSPNPGYRVKWIATVNSVVTHFTHYFDLVRYIAQHRVTPLDVDLIHPGWLDGLPPDHQVDQGRALIEAAFEAVKHELYRDGKADQSVRNAEMLSRLTIHRAQYERLLNNAMRGAGNADALAVAKTAWDSYYQGVIRAPIAPIDLAGDGASTVNRPLSWTRR